MIKGWINALFDFQFERHTASCVTRSSLQLIEIVAFAVLLYLYKRRNVKHIVVVMLLVALLGMDKEAPQLGSGVTAGTVFCNQSSFCCLATKNGHSPSCFQWGGINTDQKFFIAVSLIHE